MRDPNNIRNRWRRYREWCIRHGYQFASFRRWITLTDAKAFRAEPGSLSYTVKLVAARDGLR